MLLQLLSATAAPTNGNKLHLEGREYALVDEEIDPSSPTPFTAVSYAWGAGREPDPLHADHKISSRTIPVLRACAKLRPIQTRFWVDAFCVHLPPGSEQQKRDLESMGFIYSAAAEVIVVLSPDAQDILREIYASRDLDWKSWTGLSEENLLKLEREDWIVRAWTYQEIVNSSLIFFTCEGSADVLVEGERFLSALGQSLHSLKKGGSNLSLLPRLNAFEDAILDWRLSDYCGRSALQIMANMDKRVQTNPEDHFYAMIGAVTTKPTSELAQTEASESFMAACEAESDYSFIYSVAPRSTTPGRKWRPDTRGDIPAILPWVCSGDGQPGHLEDETLVLEKMVVFQPGSLGPVGSDFLNEMLKGKRNLKDNLNGEDLVVACSEYLISLGSRNCDQSVELSRGLFFPYKHISEGQTCSIAVCTTVYWTFGAPGLAYYEDEGEMQYIPGVFIGDSGRASGTASLVSVHLP